MTRVIRTVFLFAYIQTLSHIRIKEAFFFGFVFPIFIFVLFGNIWGGAEKYDYAKFLLSGVIAMTITSDSIFSIGPVIRAYRSNNIIKFLKNLPISILYHFMGFFLSKIIVMVIAIVLLCLTSIIFFNTRILMADIFLYTSGIFLGTIMFAFLSLNVSLYSNPEGGRGVLSFVFFIMLFLSGAFYPIEFIPSVIRPISYALPLTHLTFFLRGDFFYFWIIILWIILLGGLFSYLFYKSSINR